MARLTRFRRSVALPCILVLVVLAVLLFRSSTSSARPAGPIYTVSQVERGLATHPTYWLNRTLWLHSYLIEACDLEAGCFGTGPDLPDLRAADTPDTPPTESLTIDFQVSKMFHSSNQFVALLQDVPLLNRLAPRRLVPGHQGYYQVEIHRVSRTSSLCDPIYCTYANLLSY
jgi:hypothetical protein